MVHKAPKGKVHEATEAIDEPEIRLAIERSGYPFEIELLHAFDDAALDPVAGFRLRVVDEDGRRPFGGDEPGSAVTREVDVMARVHVGCVVKNGFAPVGSLGLTLLALIEAKSLAPDTAFVGFTHTPSQPVDMTSMRCRFAGAPTNFLPHFTEANGIGLTLASSLQPLNVGPICFQWAVIERANKNGKSQPRADHTVPFAASLSNLVRGERILASENSEFLLAMFGDQARVDFMQPTLFIKTPHLYVYNPIGKTLTPTPHLMLIQYFEVGGTQDLRVIDGVANGDVDAFAARYHHVRENLERAAEQHGSTILDVARLQAKRFAERYPDRVAAVKASLLG